MQYDLGGMLGLNFQCVMLLDFYAYTLDDDAMAMYIPLLTERSTFLRSIMGTWRFTINSIFPTQALERTCVDSPANPGKLSDK